MDTIFEKKLIEKIKPIYKMGRAGDWDHILRMVNLCKYLLEHENGDKDIVLPTAYLHDLGWSAIDFSDFNKA
ncbi:MAG: metal-dependent phosphohydrolase, partial [Proteobacteria bacterium]|nr:metal-dependent phosphohydrolase [Pseudomonadota bacterium]